MICYYNVQLGPYVIPVMDIPRDAASQVRDLYIPPELVDKILANIAQDANAKANLTSCSLVSYKWRDVAYPHQFRILNLRFEGDYNRTEHRDYDSDTDSDDYDYADTEQGDNDIIEVDNIRQITNLLDQSPLICHSVRLLHLSHPRANTPVDISLECLTDLLSRFPHLKELFLQLALPRCTPAMHLPIIPSLDVLIVDLDMHSWSRTDTFCDLLRILGIVGRVQHLNLRKITFPRAVNEPFPVVNTTIASLAVDYFAPLQIILPLLKSTPFQHLESLEVQCSRDSDPGRLSHILKYLANTLRHFSLWLPDRDNLSELPLHCAWPKITVYSLRQS